MSSELLSNPTSSAGAPSPGPVIEAHDLSFAFGLGELRRQVLFDLNFEVRSGEIVLLTGPSGSGKTTLLTLIGGLRRITEGQLSVLGRPLHRATAADLTANRRDIGFIFQQHNLLEFLSARQNVELMFQLHPEVPPETVRQKAVEILTLVGLAERLDYHPSRLSGGQRQRVAIARALVTQPRLVLADEPTAALDSVTGRDVVDLLQYLARTNGCPILMVTHDNRVLDIADRILHMEDGRLRTLDR
ncbi:MAG: ATP-binding cassette domain-containing protein [Planctomycetaceae bacterium]|jgi:putative ABC transport system ATP-binding protein